MKILMCGSRDWSDPHIIYVTLAGAKQLADSLEEPLILVHGVARGADTIAKEMASMLGIEVIDVPADWNTHGKKAGPLRNQKMLDDHKIEVTYAFRLPGRSVGTDDMVERSKAAGIPTYVIRQA